jgi:hypothetical protein
LLAFLVERRCFEEGLYDASRVIFSRIPSWGRLASTLVKLHQFQAAVDAARKANNARTWKEVRAGACVCSAAAAVWQRLCICPAAAAAGAEGRVPGLPL